MKIFFEKMNINILKKLFVIILIFFLGILFERLNIKNIVFNKLVSFVNQTTSFVSSSIYSNFIDYENLIINVNNNNYNKLQESRIQSLKQGRASEDLRQWVNADLSIDNKKYKAKIKLKGVHPDHWEDPIKWSFNVKLEENNEDIYGLKRFSIQKPSTRDYLYEWLFMRALEKEGLIFHRSKYLKIKLNNNNLGLYYLEETYSKDLIQNNKRPEGPIIGLSKDLWIEEANNLNRLSINTIDNSFWRAKIEPIQFSDKAENTQQETYLKEAIKNLESFRSAPELIEKFIDTNQLAKTLALKTIFGSYEYDWKDLKFYYNPITKLLEPISKEVHVSNETNKTFNWWTGNVFEKDVILDDQVTFLKLLFNNIKFYELYLKELDRLLDKNYINDLIKENQKDFDHNIRLLKINFPLNKIFSLELFATVRKNINLILNPIQLLNVYYLKNEKNYLFLNIQNLQHLPVKLENLVFLDNYALSFDKELVIDGYQSNKPLADNVVKVYCLRLDFCKDKISDSILEFKILGQKIIKKANVSKYYELKKTSLLQKK